MKIYVLKDLKSDYLNSLMVMANDDLAKRAYHNTLMDKQPNMVNMNPQDFELYCLGEYDVQSGIIKSDIRFVANSSTLLRPQGPEKAV